MRANKEVPKECQLRAVRSAQHPVVAVQFTVSERIGQSRRHPLFSQVHEAGGAPSRRTAGVRSPGTVEQRHKLDRMRHWRARTMRQQLVWMPLPQVAGADARETAYEHLGFPE
jgi:hypothetical protein